MSKNFIQTPENNEYRYIEPAWLDSIATVMTANAKKYPDETWRSIPPEEHAARAIRHLNLYRQGDISENHLANASVRCMMAFETDRKRKLSVPDKTATKECFAEEFAKTMNEKARQARIVKEKLPLHESDCPDSAPTNTPAKANEITEHEIQRAINWVKHGKQEWSWLYSCDCEIIIKIVEDWAKNRNAQDKPVSNSKLKLTLLIVYKFITNFLSKRKNGLEFMMTVTILLSTEK